MTSVHVSSAGDRSGVMKFRFWKGVVYSILFYYVLEGSESESHSVLSNSLQTHGLYSPWDSSGQNAGVGSLSLLQGIFPTQGSDPGLLHHRWILYQLSYQGSLKESQVGPGILGADKRDVWV